MKNLTLFQFQYKVALFPLGALYLAYGLEKENIQFDLKICLIYPLYTKKTYKKRLFDLDKLYTFFSKSRKIVAVGCWSDKLPHVLIALKRLKQKHPEKIIILGGVGPTNVAEDILKKFKFIDYIIKGCGVVPLPQLIKKINNNDDNISDITGLVYRSKGKIISNTYSGYYLNIPPIPAYHRLKNIEKIKNFSMITSFGCPYKCTFCDTRPISPKKVIYRDINEVIEEIKLIKTIVGQRKYYIDIEDEAFAINRKRVMKFCDLLESNKLNIKWGCFGRIGCMDEEMIKKMSKAGCIAITYGIESGSNKILEKIKKGFTVGQALEVLILTKKYIPSVQTGFICMFPFETRKDFLETLFIIYVLISKGISIALFPLVPVTNSEIYRKYSRSLSFSLEIPSCVEVMNTLPKECISLIKNNPKIFYNFYHYKFKELQSIVHLFSLLDIFELFKVRSDKILKELSK